MLQKRLCGLREVSAVFQHSVNVERRIRLVRLERRGVGAEYVENVVTLLPERIPTHWNLAGQADGWSSPAGFLLYFQGILLFLLLCHFIQLRFLRKQPDYAAIGKRLIAAIMGFLILTMLFAFGLGWYASEFGPPAPMAVSGFFLGSSLLCLFLLYRYTPRMFPGQPENAAITRQILLASLLFFTLLGGFAVAAAAGMQIRADRVVLSGIGWLFAVLGNLMPKLKTNPWSGIRVKWTLEDPEIWYKTHRLGGRLWIADGLVLAVAPFLCPPAVVRMLLLPVIAVLTLIPIFYAWRLARRKRRLTGAPQDGRDSSRSA